MTHPVDVHVGKRIRNRRQIVNMTQQRLGGRVGVTFQQIQKYETGANRVSASRLSEIAQTLKVRVTFFFEGLEEDGSPSSPEKGDLLTDKEALDLVRMYYNIPKKQRHCLFKLVKALAQK